MTDETGDQLTQPEEDAFGIQKRAVAAVTNGIPENFFISLL